PQSAVPLQRRGRRRHGRAIERRLVARRGGWQRREGRRLGGAGVVPHPLELRLEPLEDGVLGREVVVLELRGRRGRRPVRRAEDRRVLTVEEDDLLVVLTGVSAPAQRNPRRVQAVDVPRVPLVVRIAVLVVLDDETDRNSTLPR